MKVVPISILIPYKKNDDTLSLWMQKRVSDDELDGLLEFPGGKVEAWELPLEACIREVKEETLVSIEKQKLELFKLYPYEYANKTVLLNVFLFEDLEGKFSEESYVNIMNNFETTLHIPAANFRIIKDLRSFLG